MENLTNDRLTLREVPGKDPDLFKKGKHKLVQKVSDDVIYQYQSCWRVRMALLSIQNEQVGF